MIQLMMFGHVRRQRLNHRIGWAPNTDNIALIIAAVHSQLEVCNDSEVGQEALGTFLIENVPRARHVPVAGNASGIRPTAHVSLTGTEPSHL